MSVLTPVTAEEAEQLDNEFGFMLTNAAFVMIDSSYLDETVVMLATPSNKGGWYNRWYRFRFNDEDRNVSRDAYALAHAIENELETVR
jgi:hypothetical protein